MMRFRYSLIIFTLAAMTVLSACSKHEDEKKPASQVAARVNSEEITVYQINSVLAKMENLDQDALPQIKRTVLDKLVEQELAVQAAADSKLDRTPDVVQAMESARREILTRAYFAKTVANLPKPTTTEINKYFDDHPELFSQRRVYNLQQIAVSGDIALFQKTRDEVGAGKSIQDIAASLKASDARFSAEGGVRAADQIPLEVLSKLKDAKDGQTVTIDGAGKLLIVHIVSTQSQPMSQTEALPRIKQFLNNKNANDAVVSEINRLKLAAKIDYVGEFSADAQSNGVAAPIKTEDSRPASKMDMDKVMSGLK